MSKSSRSVVTSLFICMLFVAKIVKIYWKAIFSTRMMLKPIINLYIKEQKKTTAQQEKKTAPTISRTSHVRGRNKPSKFMLLIVTKHIQMRDNHVRLPG